MNDELAVSGFARFLARLTGRRISRSASTDALDTSSRSRDATLSLEDNSKVFADASVLETMRQAFTATSYDASAASRESANNRPASQSAGLVSGLPRDAKGDSSSQTDPQASIELPSLSDDQLTRSFLAATQGLEDRTRKLIAASFPAEPEAPATSEVAQLLETPVQGITNVIAVTPDETVLPVSTVDPAPSAQVDLARLENLARNPVPDESSAPTIVESESPSVVEFSGPVVRTDVSHLGVEPATPLPEAIISDESNSAEGNTAEIPIAEIPIAASQVAPVETSISEEVRIEPALESIVAMKQDQQDDSIVPVEPPVEVGQAQAIEVTALSPAISSMEQAGTEPDATTDPRNVEEEFPAKIEPAIDSEGSPFVQDAALTIESPRGLENVMVSEVAEQAESVDPQEPEVTKSEPSEAASGFTSEFSTPTVEAESLVKLTPEVSQEPVGSASAAAAATAMKSAASTVLAPAVRDEFNRTNLDYRRPMPRPKVRGKVIDFHCHLFALRHARDWFEAADHYGMDYFVTMTPLEEAVGLAREWGHRLRFNAVPQWGDTSSRWVDNWRTRIESFYNLGSRIAKFHASPGTMIMRGYRLDDPIYDPLFAELRSRGMAIMTHIGDPETWYQSKYTDTSKFGNRDDHFRMWEYRLEQNRGVPWVGAHMGGNPEDLPRLQRMLDKYPDLMFDCSATRWMVREISARREPAREFFIRNQDRILFGSDQVSGDDRRFDFLASRIWCHRKLWETAYTGPSPIIDPDLPTETQPVVRGLALPDVVLQKIYHDNAAALLARIGMDFPQ